MGFTCGIIGLPNVGKSTIFNALTSAKAAAANFPFCTIEPNTGAVPVPDPRIDRLATMAKSIKTVPTQMTFVDIAGLIRGASKGEGLGNQFLGHIRSVDAVAHVVRCFDDDNIVHVDGGVNPARDVDTINTELMLSDLDTVQRSIQRLEKIAKSGDKDAKAQLTVLQALDAHLSAGKMANSFISDALPEVLSACTGNLLSAKPVMFVGNVAEADLSTAPDPNGGRAIDKLAALAKQMHAELVVISGQVEAEIAELSAEDRSAYLAELKLDASGLDRMTLAGYRLLHLMTFFTVGPKETHAWTVIIGTKAPQCAGKIHSDFEKGFIRAEVIGYDDFISAGSEARARELGKLRVEGKEYQMQDGDIVHFRFNV